MTSPTDNFRVFPPQWVAPFQNGFSIAPSNSANLNYVTRALWVGSAGSLVVDLSGGSSNVTISGIPAGTLLPLRAIKVKATSTANNIVGLY